MLTALRIRCHFCSMKEADDELDELGRGVLTGAWLAALDRRIYRERSKENQIKPELLNRGLSSFCHGKARRKALPVVQSRHM